MATLTNELDKTAKNAIKSGKSQGRVTGLTENGFNVTLLSGVIIYDISGPDSINVGDDVNISYDGNDYTIDTIRKSGFMEDGVFVV